MKEYSTQPRKQRLANYNKNQQARVRSMAAHLSDELLKEYGLVRSVVVRKGDTVKVVRGIFRGHTAKVAKVFPKKGRVSIEEATLTKADGKKVARMFRPSKLILTKLDLSDPWRREKLSKFRTPGRAQAAAEEALERKEEKQKAAQEKRAEAEEKEGLAEQEEGEKSEEEEGAAEKGELVEEEKKEVADKKEAPEKKEAAGQKEAPEKKEAAGQKEAPEKKEAAGQKEVAEKKGVDEKKGVAEKKGVEEKKGGEERKEPAKKEEPPTTKKAEGAHPAKEGHKEVSK